MNSPKDRLAFENDYQIVEYVARTINEAASYRDTSIMLDEAHKYVQQYCMDDGWGRNVWHTILNDAIKLRREQK